MKTFGKILLAGVLAISPIAAIAQDDDSESSEVTPEQAAEARADVQRGVTILRAFNVAMNSNRLTQRTRGQIFTCLYRNPIRRISNAAQQVLAENSNLEEDNPTHVYLAAIRACGITVERTQGDAGADGSEAKEEEGR